MIERKEYLDQLIRQKDEQVIKVATGILRCGKPMLLFKYHGWLKQSGVSEKWIVSINFEEPEHEGKLCFPLIQTFEIFHFRPAIPPFNQ